MTDDEREHYEHEIAQLKEELALREYELATLTGTIPNTDPFNISIGHDTDRKRVVIEFGCRLKWFTVSSHEARGLSRLILEHAAHAEAHDH
jgi:hypothetical protein